jgi:hypothetical protein
MTNYLVTGEEITAVADKARKLTGSTDPIMWEDLPSAVYDKFWEACKPTTQGYCCFSGQIWNDTTFNPSKDIVLTGFCSTIFASTDITDLAAKFKTNNVTLDISKATDLSYAFYQNNKMTKLPTLDFSSATNLTYCLHTCNKIVEIEKIIVSANTTFATTFLRLTNLETCIFEGVIAKNNLNLRSPTKLSKESITSVINCLSSTTSGLTVTLSQTAVNNAFTTAEWSALEATKSNWTISLV